MTGAVQVSTRATEPGKHEAHWKHRWRKRAITLARWSHIYLSMVSFAILFFFAVTGLTLNHQDWFAHQQRTIIHKGAVDRAWLGKDVAQLQIVEQLRRAHGIHAGLGDFRIDDGQIAIDFKGPGYTADIFVDRETGSYEVTETRMGLGAVMNDLHKGRDAGRAWAMLVDVAAVFMTLVSLTGLSLIFFLAKWRRSGLIMLAAGAAACIALYVVFVP